jgi:hypothetical protein
MPRTERCSTRWSVLLCRLNGRRISYKRPGPRRRLGRAKENQTWQTSKCLNDRWWLMRDEKLCSVYLNRHVGSDDVHAPRDHRWDNMSIILEGEFSEKLYEEHEPRETVVRTKGDVVVRAATLSHRIEMRPGEECWTLFVTGPAINKWCFKYPGGPVPPDQTTHRAQP